jgi:hypothetical protein
VYLHLCLTDIIDSTDITIEKRNVTLVPNVPRRRADGWSGSQFNFGSTLREETEDCWESITLLLWFAGWQAVNVSTFLSNEDTLIRSMILLLRDPLWSTTRNCLIRPQMMMPLM